MKFWKNRSGKLPLAELLELDKEDTMRQAKALAESAALGATETASIAAVGVKKGADLASKKTKELYRRCLEDWLERMGVFYQARLEKMDAWQPKALEKNVAELGGLVPRFWGEDASHVGHRRVSLPDEQETWRRNRFRWNCHRVSRVRSGFSRPSCVVKDGWAPLRSHHWAQHDLGAGEALRRGALGSGAPRDGAGQEKQGGPSGSGSPAGCPLLRGTLFDAKRKL